MSGFLLDTNVISELVKPRPHPGVAKWIESTDESLFHISVLTLGEIRRGITLLADGRRRASLESWLDHELSLRFSGRILTIDLAIADRWGRLSAAAKAAGRPVPVIDGLLASTAIHRDMTLVSRDESYSLIAGLALFNPWKS